MYAETGQKMDVSATGFQFGDDKFVLELDLQRKFVTS
jgi:hypothetical protein